MSAFVIAFFLFLTLLAVALGVFLSTFPGIARMKPGSKRMAYHAAVGSIILAGVFLLWICSGWGSMGPTAKSLAMVVIPIYLLMVIPVGFVVSWSAVYAAQFLRERLGNAQPRITSLPSFILAVLVLSCSLWIAQTVLRRTIELAAASSPATSPADLSQLLGRAIQQHDVEVMGRIARNKNTAVDDLRRLFATCKSNLNREPTTDYEVFYGLAQNPRTPPEILTALATSHEDSTRIVLAMNPSVPVESLRALARDSDDSVRTWLTSNPNLPIDVLESLTHDRDQITRNYAESHLESRQKISDPVR